MMGLQEGPLFQGRAGRLLLTYDLTALERRMYYRAGILIGWSLAHGGPGPRCLHPALFQVGAMSSSGISLVSVAAHSPARLEVSPFNPFVATADVRPESLFRGFQLERRRQS